jgi:SMODS-associating 4TM effector domain
MNEIPARQNSPRFLKLLRARSQVYAVAVRLQVFQIVLTVIAPLAGGILGIFYVPWRGYVASSILVIMIAEIVWLDRALRSKLRLAARISEEFDCGLLEMPRNSFVTGPVLDPEVIEKTAMAWSKGVETLRVNRPGFIGGHFV